MSEKEDNATVVVNIKDLKKHYEELSDISEIDNLEFLVDSEEPKIENANLAVFDYKGNTLQEMIKIGIIPNYAKVLTDPKELNEYLKIKEIKHILFNYHIEPKAINTLLTQINKISPKTVTIVVAQGLTDQFINKHQSSTSKATKYLNYPFKLSDLTDMLKV